MSSIRRRFQLWFGIQVEEFVPALCGFAWFFCLLFAYYILRPIRETLATQVGTEYVNRLFAAVFCAMVSAVPIYSYLVARYARRRFVPWVTRFFAVWLIGFSLVIFRYPDANFWIGCVYFVWLSVFNLFVVSVFWSVMADTFSSDQGKRLFGLIAAGGSLGGICSSLVVGQLAESVAVWIWLLVSIAVLELSLACFRVLERVLTKQRATQDVSPGAVEEPAPQEKPVANYGVWQGLIRAFQSPYLFGICLFLLLGKFCATTVYLQLLDIVTEQVDDPARRTELFAHENTATLILTLTFQIALTGFIMQRFGISWTLVMLPLALVIGFALLSVFPVLSVAFAIQVLQRGLTYGVAEPARSVLFTVVSREDKYKTKSFIDTVIFRGGDVAASNLHKSLVRVFGSAHQVTLWMLPIAVVWAIISWFLGQKQRQLTNHVEASP